MFEAERMYVVLPQDVEYRTSVTEWKRYRPAPGLPFYSSIAARQRIRSFAIESALSAPRARGCAELGTSVHTGIFTCR